MPTGVATETAVAALQLLAADANEQTRQFPEYVAAAEELALTIQNAILLLEQDTERDGAPQSLVDGLRELDCALDALSVESEAWFWSNEGLVTDVRWQRLRLRARQLLKQLGVARAVPTRHDTYERA